MNKKQNKKQPFDYNAELLSLTKANIFSINKDLNFVIKDMQKEIDLYRQRNNILHGKLGQSEIELNISLEKELSLLQDNLDLQKKITYQTTSNTRFIKELIFLNNRNFFQRLFNIQYKENE